MMKKYLSISLLTALYLLLSFHYYPDNLGRSVLETLIHIVRISPFNIGLALLLLSLFKRMNGAIPSWGGIIRIYLTLAVFIEILFGLNVYFAPK